MTRFSPVIVHYHLFPGGVSSLILSSIRALIQSHAIQGEVTFALGTADRSEWFFKALNDVRDSGVAIRTEIIPELMYWDKSLGDVNIPADKIKAALMRLCAGERVLWAHNPTLGKNPAYMLALKKIGQAEPDFRMFLHVHDSAEQGRWPNLNLMRSTLPEPYYFVSPGSQWLVINRNDYNAFLKSGMPEEHLTYFPDVIVMPDGAHEKGKSGISALLGAFAESNGFAFDGKLPWVMFAGRTIRRKNLLEALAINLCAPGPTNFLITLPSDSPDDKPYEDMVFGQLKKHRAGVAGFGPTLVGHTMTLSNLALECDLIMSSSVMEGFGLPYLEFPMIGRPVFAKSIYIMEDFKGIEANLPHHCYQAFRVPVEAHVRDYQKKRYLEKVEILSGRFNIPEDHTRQVKDFFIRAFSEPAVDFSYLSASEQHSFLNTLPSGMKAGITELNEGLFSEFQNALQDTRRSAPEVARAIRSRFSTEEYEKNLVKVLKSYENDRNCTLDAARFQEKLLACYFNPEDLRLLLDYRPYH